MSEKASKGSFLGPDKLQITLRNREKERARRKKKGGEEKKNNGCTLSFYNAYFGRKIYCWTRKVHFAVRFSKIRLDIYKQKDDHTSA